MSQVPMTIKRLMRLAGWLMLAAARTVAEPGEVAVYREAGAGEDYRSATATDVQWDSTVREDTGTFSLQTPVITLADIGHYLVMWSMTGDQNGTDRAKLEGLLNLDGTPLAAGRGWGYLRDSGGSLASYCQGAAIVETSAAGQALKLQVRRLDTNTGGQGWVRRGDTSGISLLKLNDNLAFARYGEDTGGQDIYLTEANKAILALSRNDEQDAGFSRGGTNGGEVTLANGGRYLVVYSVGVNSSVERNAVVSALFLDGAEVAGTRVTGYIRNSQGDAEGGVSYVGLIDAAALQKLTVRLWTDTYIGTGSPTATVDAGRTVVAVAKVIDRTAEYVRSHEAGGGQQLTTTQSNVTFDTDDETGSAFTRPATDEFRTQAAGDYLFMWSAFALKTSTGDGSREHLWTRLTVDDVLQPYASAGNFIRGDQSTYDVFSGGASGGAVLSALTAGRAIRVVQQNEANDATAGMVADRYAAQGVRLAPEMALFGNGQEIADGDTTPAAVDDTEYGLVGVGTPVQHTFTITNDPEAWSRLRLAAERINGLTEYWYDGDFADAQIDDIDSGSGFLTMTPGAATTLDRSLQYDDWTIMDSRSGGLVGEDYIGAAWVGYVTIGAAGSGAPLEAGAVTFATHSDDGSTFWVDLDRDGLFSRTGAGGDEMLVDNKGAHGDRWRFGTATVAAGSYKVALGFYEDAGGETMEARYAQGTTTDETTMTTVDPSAPGQDGLWTLTLPSALDELWFDGGGDPGYGDANIDPVDGASGFLTLVPTITGALDTALAFDDTAISTRQPSIPADYMGIAWRGYLTVGAAASGAPLEPGSVSFATRSDDGSTLWVDLDQDGRFERSGANGDEMVVDNKGLHAAQNRFGTVTLAEGVYAVAIAFYEEGSLREMTARYAQGTTTDWAAMTTIDVTAPGQAGLWTPSPVTVSGDAAFTVTAQPAQPDLAPGASTTFTIQFLPTGPGTVSATVSVAGNDTDESPYTFVVQGSGSTGPEMKVSGGSPAQEIADGNSTPSVADDTDFGPADVVTGTVLHTFTIENTGAQPLDLTDSPRVTIGGTHATDFTLTSDAVTPVASGGGSTTFQISFDPGAVGLRTATVSIANSDGDENPYDFSIQGTGTVSPEMDVQGNGQSIANGDTSPGIGDDTDFGDADIDIGSVDHTFTIENTGTGPLNLGGSPRVQISGPHAADFTVTSLPALPATPVAAAGGTTTFVIHFDPGATGLRQATVTIPNDDSDEAPYSFGIWGTGVVAPAAEMNVTGNGQSIVDGDTSPAAADHTDFGNAAAGSGTVQRTFTIENLGNLGLDLTTDPRVALSDTTHFRLVADAGTPVAPSGSTTFTVEFRPLALGSFTITLSIANSDSNENPYTFDIRGAGVPDEPEMGVFGNGVEIVSGAALPSVTDDTDFRTAVAGSGSVTHTFTIRNDGVQPLVLAGVPKVALGGPGVAAFLVTAQPSSPVAAGGTTTFEITFEPAAVGTFDATVTIANNDSTESPYTFEITGEGVTVAPEMDVFGNTIEIPDGDMVPSGTDGTDYGTWAENRVIDHSFTISNNGDADLTLSGGAPVTLSGDAQFTVQSQPPLTVLSPETSTTFVIRFSATTVGGPYAATVTIANDDGDEGPYDFAVQGRVKKAGHNSLAMASAIECSECHSVHGESLAGTPLPRGATQEAVCQQCHQDTNPYGAPFNVSNHVVNNDGVTSTVLDCGTCHEVHDGQDMASTNTRTSTTADNVRHVRPLIQKYDGKPEDWTPLAAPQGAVYQNADTFAFTTVNASGNYDGVCQVCHTTLATHNNAGAGDRTHGISDTLVAPLGLSCTACHPHGEGFGIRGCTRCHDQVRNGRRQIVEDGGGTGGDFERASHHVSNGTTTEIVQDNDCLVCHFEGIDGVEHREGDVDLRDPDTGGHVFTYTGNGSQIETFCLNCHDAAGADHFDANSALAGTQPFPDDANGTPQDVKTSWTGSAHDTDGDMPPHTCLSCHGGPSGHTDYDRGAHGSDHAQMLSALADSRSTVVGGSVEEGLCYACHDGSPAGTDVEADFAKANRHPVADSDQSAGREVECTDCHNPHAAQAGVHSYSATANSTRNAAMGGVLTGVSGVEPTYGGGNFAAPTAYTEKTYAPPGASGADREYQICFKCHSDYNGQTSPVATEFSSKNKSGHPVMTGLSNYPNSVSPKSLPASDMKAPWNTNVGTQTMTCTDCHNTDSATTAAQGPHGSAVNFMLRTRFPTSGTPNPAAGPTAWPDVQSQNFGDSWCANCHNMANKPHNDRSAHRSRKCWECHIVIPHGGKMSRLIGDRDGNMPARYAYQGNQSNLLIQRFAKKTQGNYKKENGGCDVSCYGEHSPGSGAENWD